ncbi:MAG TPA: helix-turn-helix transcriptional regulator [Hyphomicrobiaceae bacterium]|nr:helix-turn-helix transcriptional regulator [Hyphomicrobiaceae bacterium]
MTLGSGMPILNLMVKYQNATLDRTFAALSDPTRRALLARLEESDGVSVSELAKPFAMSLPAVMKHLDVLSDAGLVTRSKIGRTVSCRLEAAPMEDAMIWLIRYQRFWSKQLDRLAAFLEEKSCPPPSAQHPAPQPSPASRSNVVSMPRRKRSTPRGPTRKD